MPPGTGDFTFKGVQFGGKSNILDPTIENQQISHTRFRAMQFSDPFQGLLVFRVDDVLILDHCPSHKVAGV